MNQREFRDLSKHAQARTRGAAELVIQLLDTDEERTAILLACALDFIKGAALSIKESTDGEATDEQAMAAVIGMLISELGPLKVIGAFKALRAQQCGD